MAGARIRGPASGYAVLYLQLLPATAGFIYNGGEHGGTVARRAGL